MGHEYKKQCSDNGEYGHYVIVYVVFQEIHDTVSQIRSTQSRRYIRILRTIQIVKHNIIVDRCVNLGVKYHSFINEKIGEGFY